MELTLKKVEKKDLEKLTCLYSQLVEKDLNFEKIKSIFLKIENDPHYDVFGVYRENDELIATVTMSKCLDLTDDSTFFYYNMENGVVDEKYRGQGVGAWMLHEVEKYAREENARYLCFFSSAKRTRAHKFYLKLGYDPEMSKGFKKYLR